MGHRASYVLIEHRNVQMYYSHWGAKSIPDTVLAGPTRAWEYIQHLTPHNELLDSVWIEGGILMDDDRRRLLFWGGEEVKYCPYLRRLFLPALRSLWPGWTVEWASHGVADFADHLDIDRSTVLIDSFPEGVDGFDSSAPAEELLRTDPEYNATAITVKQADGRIADYLFQHSPGFILSAGPRLLDILPDTGSASLPDERGDIEGGAFLDVEAREMWVWNVDTIDPRYLEALAQLWVGWQVHGHVEGLVRQVILSGRDPTDIMVPRGSCRGTGGGSDSG